jgi:acyl-CoA dehydrogenase
MSYEPPIAAMMIALWGSAGLAEMIAAGELADLDGETVDGILTEAGRFAAERLAPLNAVGDAHPARLENGVVTTPPGWQSAYRDWCTAGWSQLPGPVAFGGQGLPHVVAMATSEMWNSANMAFGLGPLLTHGAIDALHTAASPELQARFLPDMVSGRWMGTMNLTEPHAGTDLGALRCKAEPAGDGSYRITGTKIYITYGDHDLTDNIIHLVLARLPGAPAGTRGISLFVVPKFLPDGADRPTIRNDLHCTSLEHKLGIHASPTCVMSYGENGGATGWLVGEAGRGLNAMFVMMNRARLAVAIQGVAIAERATQGALAYARQRQQGRVATTPSGQMAPIIEHADVRRMLMTMQSGTAVTRALCYAAAGALDRSERASDPAKRAAAADRISLLTPIAKAYATDMAVTVASLGIQIHGGAGFVEATGAAQHYRDARILPIYEGTNGVQAIDLVTRKLPLSDGKALAGLCAELRDAATTIAASEATGRETMAKHSFNAILALEEMAQWLVEKQGKEPESALALATPFQELLGATIGGTLLALSAAKATTDPDLATTARHHWLLAGFFADTVIATIPSRAKALREEAPLPAAAEFA